MGRLATWTLAAVVGLVLVADVADARHRRRHRGGDVVVYSSDGRTSYYYDSSGARVSLYPPGEVIPAPGRVEGVAGSGAELEILTPADGQVWIDGRLLESRGERHRYPVADFRSGQPRSFEVRAQWNDNGRVVNQTRTVNVDASGRMNVDFNRPAPSNPAPKQK